MADDEPDLQDVLDRMARIQARFEKLTEDFTQLRHEVNELERKVDRRT